MALTIDHEEVEIMLMALRRFRSEAAAQMDGRGTYFQVIGAAWYSCKYTAAKCDEMIERIEQWQKDEAEEAKDG